MHITHVLPSYNLATKKVHSAIPPGLLAGRSACVNRYDNGHKFRGCLDLLDLEVFNEC